jgi:flagellar hook assembly protein FlgD
VTPAQATLAIHGIIPNPTAGATRVDFEVPRDSRALIEVYNVAGARVKTLLDGTVKAGPNSATWDARGSRGELMPPGTYFIRLTVGDQKRYAKVSVTR